MGTGKGGDRKGEQEGEEEEEVDIALRKGNREVKRMKRWRETKWKEIGRWKD